MSDLLHTKLAAVRRKRAAVAVATAVGAAVGVAVLVATVEMMIDWWFELSFTVRAAVLAIELAAAVTILVRWAVLPLVAAPDDDELALTVERSVPEFRSRLISAVQLIRPGAVPAGAAGGMVAALVRETERVAEPIDFAAVIPTRDMTRVLSLAAVAVVLGIAGLAYGGATAADLLKRHVLVPGVDVPRKTRVVVTDGDMAVAKGDAVTLAASADGIVPKAGTIRLYYASNPSRPQTFTMEADPANPAAFARAIDAVPESFEYEVQLYDGRSKRHKVDVVPRPAVQSLELRQIFPPYAKLPDAQRMPGDLSLLAGSRLAINVRATKRVRTAPSPDGRGNRVRLVGSDVDFPLQPDPSDPTRLTAVDGGARSVPLPPGTTAFKILLVDANGVTSKDETAYRIDLVPDRAPQVVVTAPTDPEMLVTPKATVDVGFDAADDFAVGQLSLVYRRLQNTEQPAASPNGLTATYFANPDLAGKPEVTQVDPIVDFSFDDNSWQGVRPAHRYSNRFQGWLVPPQTGQYRFKFPSDDGMRFTLDGRKVVDKWGGPTEPQTEPLTLEGGRRYSIIIEHANSGGGPSHLRFLWSKDGGAYDLVPEDALRNLDAERLEKARDEHTIRLDVGPAQQRAVRGYYPWVMSRVTPSLGPGDVIEWWLEVRDTNDATGPGVTRSERHTIRVVTEAEKRAELMSRVADRFGRIDELSGEQADLSQRLGTMVREAPDGAPARR
ncbi:MAG TPA: PA14 domain-containing protein [Tepidisphaeraceae bacterium]|nr:PA14 domain-containing protein [Tepidisphaeraceae bacterium]